jgi:FtsZ-binding cell division protein ZapB
MMDIFDILMFTVVFGTMSFGVYKFIDLIAEFDSKVTHIANKNKQLTTRVAELTAANEALVNEKQSTENSSLFKENAELMVRCEMLTQEIENLNGVRLRRTPSYVPTAQAPQVLTRSYTLARPETQYGFNTVEE